MVEAYWVYGLCVDQHAIQIRTHVFWQPGLRATEREGAFVWLELVCCPKPSAALSVIICSENNSSFLGADSQSWFESSPACLRTLFVLFYPSMVLCDIVVWICPLRQWICVLLSLDLCSSSLDLCVFVLWICGLTLWICALLCFGFVLYVNGFLFCCLGFVLSFHGFVPCCTLDFGLLPWICALLFFGFVLYMNGFVFCFNICALLQCCFVSLCSHSMKMCFWLFFFSHLCTEWISTTDAVCFQTVLMRWWR